MSIDSNAIAADIIERAYGDGLLTAEWWTNQIAAALDAAFERGRAEGARIENEACAKVAEDADDDGGKDWYDEGWEGFEKASATIAKAIRARLQPSGGAK